MIDQLKILKELEQLKLKKGMLEANIQHSKDELEETKKRIKTLQGWLVK